MLVTKVVQQSLQKMVAGVQIVEIGWWSTVNTHLAEKNCCSWCVYALKITWVAYRGKVYSKWLWCKCQSNAVCTCPQPVGRDLIWRAISEFISKRTMETKLNLQTQALMHQKLKRKEIRVWYGHFLNENSSKKLCRIRTLLSFKPQTQRSPVSTWSDQTKDKKLWSHTSRLNEEDTWIKTSTALLQLLPDISAFFTMTTELSHVKKMTNKLTSLS